VRVRHNLQGLTTFLPPVYPRGADRRSGTGHRAALMASGIELYGAEDTAARLLHVDPRG
jgi:hypothetical protein